MKLNPYFTPYVKINSKCIKDSNVRKFNCKTIRRKHRGKLPDIGLAVDFLDMTLKVQTIKVKIGISSH